MNGAAGVVCSRRTGCGVVAGWVRTGVRLVLDAWQSRRCCARQRCTGLPRCALNGSSAVAVCGPQSARAALAVAPKATLLRGAGAA
jgi:hypothetical protein